MLILLAAGMIAIIVVLLAVNPADKPIAELLPAVILCFFILAGSLVTLVFFLVPKKIKTKTASSGTLSFDGWRWNGRSPGDIKAYLEQYSVKTEEVSWEEKAGKAAWLKSPLKITLFLVVLFEVIFAAIAIFFDIGLSNKLKTFFVLQSGLIIPLVAFVAMCFQGKGYGMGGNGSSGHFSKDVELPGYRAEVFQEQKCKKCGGAVFTVEGKREEQLYRMICKACGEMEYIEDSADFWDETDAEITFCRCANESAHDAMYLTLGHALHEDKTKSWLYIGYLCAECGALGCIDEIKLA